MRFNILASHSYLRDDATFRAVMLGTADLVNLLIDSGAFTVFFARIGAACQGKPPTKAHVTIDDYIEACRAYYAPHAWGYVALDVMRNRDATMANLDAMVAAGLRPMPVLLEGVPMADARTLVSYNPRVCVAGGFQSLRQNGYLLARYAGVMAEAPDAKLHALGYQRYPDLLSAHFASCDSVTYMNGQRFGTVMWFGGKGMVSRKRANNGGYTAMLGAAEAAFLRRRFEVTEEQWNTQEQWSGQLGIGALITRVTHIEMQRRAAVAGRDIFFGLNSYGDMVILLCCALADDGGRCPIEAIRAHKHRLDALRRADKSLKPFLEAMREGLREAYTCRRLPQSE